METKKTRWYKDAVIYQIYPRSFLDSDNDGIGDIRGIISKLDYLKDLGITAVWLSPVYKSPNDDNGYDISDYRDIMTEFGTLDDWKEMIAGMHERGIKLIMDLVVNHTSDEHSWFTESKKGEDNPYRDYYFWRKGKGENGKRPPNNWTSRFMGSAWERIDENGDWYMHLFSKKQPDLNWDNEKVRQEVVDIIKYWCDMGVDGFRCDVITVISKNPELPDGKFNVGLVGDEHFVIGPKLHEYLKQLNREGWSQYDTMVVGEAFGIKFEDAESLIAEENEELDMVFNFEHMETDMLMQFFPVKFNLPKFKKVMDKWQGLPNNCWNALFLENHDQPRSLPRFVGDYGKLREAAGKMLATMLLMQKGTPFIYQGEEIGMTNCEFDRNEYVDIMAKQIFGIFGKFGLSFIANYAMKKRARDHARTPMQWNREDNGGFTKGTPWMKVNPNYLKINVENNLLRDDSLLNYYKALIKFRKGDKIVKEGEFIDHDPLNKWLYSYERKLGNESYFVVCNFNNKAVKFNVPPDFEFDRSTLMLSNYPTDNFDRERNTFADSVYQPYEARIYAVERNEN